MKKIILILLISFKMFSQTENFTVDKNTIFWKSETEKSLDDYLSETNPKLEIVKISDIKVKGVAKNMKCDCKGISMFLYEEFDADLSIDKTNNKAIISIYNIRFKNSIRYELYGTGIKKESDPIEDFVLKKDRNLKTTKQALKNLQCLDKYFIDLFSL